MGTYLETMAAAAESDLARWQEENVRPGESGYEVNKLAIHEEMGERQALVDWLRERVASGQAEEKAQIEAWQAEQAQRQDEPDDLPI